MSTIDFRENQVSRRTVLKVAAVSACAALAAPLMQACATSGPAGTPPSAGTTPSAGTPVAQSGQVKLRFAWMETTPAQLAFMEKALQEWHAEHPEIQVELVKSGGGIGEQIGRIVSSIASGDPFELSDIGIVGALSALAVEGHLEPLDDLIAEAGGPDAFMPDSLWAYEGHYYNYPYDTNIDLMYWRKDLLDAKGLPVPKTWDEWLNVAKALTDKPKPQYGTMISAGGLAATDQYANQFIYGAGASILDQNFNVVMDKEPNRTRIIRALEFSKKLREYMPPGISSAGAADMLKLYGTGQAASVWYVGRLPHYLADNAPQLIPVTVSSVIPTDEGKYKALNGGADGWVVPKSKYSKEAKQFLRWLVTKKLIGFQLAICSHTVPTEKATWTNPAWRESECVNKYWDAAIKTQLEIADEIVKGNLRQGDLSNEGTKMQPNGVSLFDRRAGVVYNSNLVGEMFNTVADKGGDPAKVLDETAANIRDLIKKQ